jgi:rhodanese-related sulfurtransferase
VVSGAVPTVGRDELQAKLARGDRFKLVMAASDFGFRAKHIPGSLHFKMPDRTSDETFGALAPTDDIVVYCSNEDCHASLAVIQKLRERGYAKVSHYAGGVIDWENARLPLEGDWAAGAH